MVARVLGPSPFPGFLTKIKQENGKRSGMTRLGSPGVSSHSVSGFFDQNQTKKRETERDDTPGEPRRVIPVRFRCFLTKIAKKLLGPKNIPNGHFHKKNSTAELEVQIVHFSLSKEKNSGNGLG